MRAYTRANESKRRSCLLLVATLALAFSTYIEQVTSLPSDVSRWPTFPRRNIAALARDGYLRTSANGDKRSISTLAKNGQLPTFRAPYDEGDRQEQDDEASHEKRNVASIARLRSYAAMKRNVQALARDGYRVGSRHSQQQDKRDPRKTSIGDEYYFPFYQNPVPPLDEFNEPLDPNELYDLEQSVNPDMFPPLSRVFKRGLDDSEPPYDNDYKNHLDSNWYLKRGSAGLPVHGLYRPVYVDPNNRNKRYVLSLPDYVENNDVDDSEYYGNTALNEDKRSVGYDSEIREGFEKRHIGSLARLGLLPSFRFSGGRYSRSGGRAQLLLKSQELYRKHTPNENFGIRKHITSPEVEPAGDTNDAYLPPQAVFAHSHPTGRIISRPLSNDLPAPPRIASVPLPPPNVEFFSNNQWQTPTPQFNYRLLKGSNRTTKRYLLIPAIDNIMLRKTSYRNSSLPSRRKNQ